MVRRDVITGRGGVQAEAQSHSSDTRFQGSTVNIYMDMQDVQPIGGSGDALFATLEKGETTFNRMVDFVAQFVEQFKKMDPQARTQVSDG